MLKTGAMRRRLPMQNDVLMIRTTPMTDLELSILISMSSKAITIVSVPLE
jgi:hypothetical protein